VIARLNRDLVDPLTYTRIAYLLVAGVFGIIEFTFLVTALSTGVGLAVTLIGIPILIASVYAWGWLAEIERRTIGSLTGNHIASPYRPLPERGWWERLRARLADPATWKDLTFLFLQFPFGLLSFIIAVTVLSVGLSGLTLPLWYWAVPDGADWTLFQLIDVDTLPEALAASLLGALVLWLGIPALGALGRFYGAYAELLLGSNEDPAVTAAMTDLRDARSRIIEAADAERRRIERDLHDGAQQRLVALSLNLRMAEKRAAEGDPAAAELVRSAGEEANLALKELRDLARGIHPAMLTNRGLTAALDDLAARASVPVEIVAVPPQRLPDQVESTVYFLVSECLANVGKHAQATEATVAVTVVGDEVEVIVKDDGVGGADLTGGSGLQGLEDRVGALDGCVDIDSPAGGGTTVMATIPLHAPAVSPEATERPALTEDEIRALAERRRRGLRYRLIALGTINLVILAVWALTGAPNAWPVWPVMSLAFIAALDAWRVYTEPAGGYMAARAQMNTRRRLIATGGALAIVNVFVIGIWIASGSSYFWPVWVMLGSVVALVLKAIPWSRAWHDRLHGTTPPAA
jgi:signal transduction histidine kinase